MLVTGVSPLEDAEDEVEEEDEAAVSIREFGGAIRAKLEEDSKASIEEEDDEDEEEDDGRDAGMPISEDDFGRT